jgi:hypothetical protein
MPKKQKQSFWLPHALPIALIFGVILFGMMYALQDVFREQEELQARLANLERPPVASITETAITEEGIVTLDGSNSFDPDGVDLTYLWTYRPENPTSVILSDRTAAITTFPAEVAGNYMFMLTVTDEDGLEDTTSTIITIVDNNQ